MPTNNTDQTLFYTFCQKYINTTKERASIGLLKEKTLHAVLKDFVVDDITCQEVKIGRFVADVVQGEDITEVQTKNLRGLTKKLDFFLQTHNVTVVFPISQTKWIYWVSPETGLIEKPNKSTIKGTFPHALAELDGIKQFLDHPRLTVKLMLLETEEYRMRDGYGKYNTRRATKMDIFPVRLIETLSVTSTADLEKLIPPNLPAQFTVAQFCACGKYKPRAGFYAKRLLTETGFITECGKQGRAVLWQIN